jgi:Flp pilus assembly protein TadG
MIFFASQTLESAVSDSARLVLTGQAQSQGFQQSDFRDAVCARVHGLLDCANGLQIDVRTYSSFSSINNTPPVDSHGNLQTSSFGYTPGAACDIVVVRLMYQWPVYISMLGLDRLANLNGSMRLIMATAAFRNEPYGSVSC